VTWRRTDFQSVWTARKTVMPANRHLRAAVPLSVSSRASRRVFLARMVIGIRRFLWARQRMLAEFFEHDSDGFFELWVVAGADGLRVEFHLEVGGHAAILDFPLARGEPEGGAGRRDSAAVDQWRVFIDADQPAPRPLADQRPHSNLAKIMRQ